MGTLVGSFGTVQEGLARDFSLRRPPTVAAHGPQIPNTVPGLASVRQTGVVGFRAGHLIYSQEGTEV